MKKYALLASAASFFAATSAIAADLPSRKVAPVAPVVPAFTWTGFYAGVNAGVNWSSRNVNTSFSDSANETPLSLLADATPLPYGNSRTGFIGGVQVGYNYQINQFVIGAEADFMGAAISKSTSAAEPFSDPQYGPSTTNVTTKVQQNWLGTVRARAGVAFDRVLVYATGGLAYGDVNTTSAITLSLPSVGYAGNWAGSKNDTKAGYTIGAGVEYAITNNWVIRAEYMYYNLGNVSVTSVGTTESDRGAVRPNQTTVSGTSRTTIDGNIIRAAISYKF